MEHVSDDAMDDLDMEFPMDDQSMDDADNKRSSRDRQYQSRRRIEEMMEMKRLKMQLGDFEDYEFSN